MKGYLLTQRRSAGTAASIQNATAAAC
jgi:hypothetical protein